MTRFTILSTFFILLVACTDNTSKTPPENEIPGPVKNAAIIPLPATIEELGANYEIAPNSTIYLHKHTELDGIATYLKNRLTTSTAGVSLTINPENSSDQGIHFILNEKPDTLLGDEGYRLNTVNNVTITANQPAGIFYGVQSLLQLLPPSVYANEPVAARLILPQVEVTDQPRYAYRGMHLDPCRHFFSVDFTKKYLDYMAYHKLNKFHWHLTEDQGWRIEIKKYPRLVEKGAKRSGTLILNHDVAWSEQQYDTIPVEGYYTQEEIKEIVAYAAERFIEVIPEIEMPGHSTAALVGYPQLSCTGGPFEVLQRPGVTPDVYCAGNDSVFVFLQDIIDEVTTLFPSQYIHIGGDECPKERWEKCPKCQERIKTEGLKDEHELQSWFISKMEKHINAKGKTLIGWSEIMEGGIAPNAILQSWLGTSAGVEAAQAHHQAIMSPYQALYFDGIYVDRAHRKMEPFGQTYCWTNTDKVYAFEPTPDTIPEAYHPYFIGAEATMWTEFIKTEAHMEYMLMPRLSALSEICWTTKDRKDSSDFRTRLNTQFLRYDEMGANYRVPHPIVADTIAAADSVVIINPTTITEIRYTLDGSEPTNTSQLYSQPFKVDSAIVLKARCYSQSGKESSIFTSIIVP